MLRFDNTYARLPERFYVRLAPTPVAKPGLFHLNVALAAELGINAAFLASADGTAILAGNRTPAGAEPLAQASLTSSTRNPSAIPSRTVAATQASVQAPAMTSHSMPRDFRSSARPVP